MITVHVDEDTLARLRKASEETGRSIEQLAADGISEYMVTGFKDRPHQDPAKMTPEQRFNRTYDENARRRGQYDDR